MPDIPGSIDRSEPKWKLWLVGDAEWMQRGQGIKYRALLEVDGEPRGYAIYRIDNNWGTSGPASTMNVQEVLGVDAAAEQALWEWLFSMDLVRTVASRRGPVPHPLQHMLIEPRRLGLVVNDGMWLRLIDVAEALGARSYVGSGSLVLDVADDMFDANAARWEVRVSDGRATVSRTTAAPDIELEVSCAGGGLPRRVPVRRPGRGGPGPWLPAWRSRTRGRAVHAAALAVEWDAVLRDRRSRSI